MPDAEPPAAPGSPSNPGSPVISVIPEAPHRRRQLRPVVALFAALALVAATAAGVLAFGGGEDDGPDAPVRALFRAAEAGDVLGMLDQLVPGERDALREPLTGIVAELERLGILDDVDLGDLGAYYLKIDGLELETETRRADLAFVRITGGTASYSFDPSSLPLGAFVRPLLGGLGGGEGRSESTNSDLASGDDGIVTVKRGGRWYISLGYTIAESARLEAGVSLDDLGERVIAKGAGSAEDAVRELVEAAAELDLGRVLALLPPGEMGAIQEYAGLFLADVRRGVAEMGGDVRMDIDNLELSSDVDGDTAWVTIDELDGTIDLGAMTIRIEGDCVAVTAPGQPTQETCGGTSPGLFGGVPGVGALSGGDLGALGSVDYTLGVLPTLAGRSGAPMRVVKVDGQWYVSPIRTLFGGFVTALAEIQEDDLGAILDSIMSLVLMPRSMEASDVNPVPTPFPVPLPALPPR